MRGFDNQITGMGKETLAAMKAASESGRSSGFSAASHAKACKAQAEQCQGAGLWH